MINKERLFIKNLLAENQLYTGIFITFLAFILGIVSSELNTVIKAVKNWCKFKNFEKMINREYIDPFHILLDDYSKEIELSSSTDISQNKEEEIKQSTIKNINRLNYLKEEEISFLNADNQFKIVRLIEFTKSYYQSSYKVLEYYSFHSPDSSKESYELDKKRRLKGIKMVKKDYKNNKNDYINLKTDHLLEQTLDDIKKNLDQSEFK